MIIIDDSAELDSLLQEIKKEEVVLVVPILTDHQLHPSINKISCIYVYSSNEIEFIVPIHHTEQITGFKEHLNKLLELESIFVHDKKLWLQMGGNNTVFDVKSLWWYTYNEAYDDNHYYTSAHNFYWRRHTNLQHVNTIVPLMKHVEMCQKIRKYAWPMIVNQKLSEIRSTESGYASYIRFNMIYPRIFAEIESNGIQVNDSFKMKELITDGRVYSNYHYHTTTGRPSNAFRGFNFAAMNKQDGTRDALCSRFENGALVEFDFDAYHVRLIARLIGYELPQGSIHTYFGKFYFGTETLTSEQYEQSKQITFRLLYGHIEKEFLKIPFFQEINDFVYSLWSEWKKDGYIETPLLKRRLYKDSLSNMNQNKLFNYFLQAFETEFTANRLNQLSYLLKGYKTCIILYTYDSVLFDVPIHNAKEILPKIKSCLEGDDFPVKCKVGNIYSKMSDIEL
tara:strand:- start:500 stop:1855 length:1356 start_codon:yes stop_codon:yes gene_type:complete